MLLILLFLGLLPGILPACGATAREQQEQITRVSVVFPHDDDGYWSEIRRGMDSCEEEAAEAGLDVSYYMPQLNYNSEEMADLILQQIAARVDVIVAQGSENEDLVAALRKAQDKGIRVILMDTDTDQLQDHLYVGSNHYKIGYDMGTAIAEAAGDCETAAVVTGTREYSNLEERLLGLRNALAEKSTLEITQVLEDSFDSATFMQCYQRAQGNDVLICIEGTGLLTLDGVGERVQDKAYTRIYGMDRYTGVAIGVVDGAMMQETYEIGHTIMEQLIHYQQEGAYSANTIYTDIYWVTQDNYDEVAQHETP